MRLDQLQGVIMIIDGCMWSALKLQGGVRPDAYAALLIRQQLRRMRYAQSWKCKGNAAYSMRS